MNPAEAAFALAARFRKIGIQPEKFSLRCDDLQIQEPLFCKKRQAARDFQLRTGPGRLSVFLFNFCPGVLELDRTVENRFARQTVPAVRAEITDAFKLEPFAGSGFPQ